MFLTLPLHLMSVNPDGTSSISYKEPWSSHKPWYLSKSNLVYSKHYTWLHAYTYKIDKYKHSHMDTHFNATKHKPLHIWSEFTASLLSHVPTKNWCSFMYMVQKHFYHLCQSVLNLVQSVRLLHPWIVWRLFHVYQMLETWKHFVQVCGFVTCFNLL